MNTLKVTGLGLSCNLAHGQDPTMKAVNHWHIAPQVLLGKEDQSSEPRHCSVLMHQRLDARAPQLASLAYKCLFRLLRLHDLRWELKGTWRRCVAQALAQDLGLSSHAFEPLLRVAAQCHCNRCDVCAGDREQRSDVCAGDREQRTQQSRHVVPAMAQSSSKKQTKCDSFSGRRCCSGRRRGRRLCRRRRFSPASSPKPARLAGLTSSRPPASTPPLRAGQQPQTC